MGRYKTSGYVRGRAFEYRVKALLESMGFVVFRLAGSKPFDLIAFSPKGNVYLIECKLRGKPSRYQREKQENIARRIGAEYILITSKNKYEVVEKIREKEGL